MQPGYRVLFSLSVSSPRVQTPAAPYCVGGGGLLLADLLLHVHGEQVVMQLHLGRTDQGAERAAGRLIALVLTADVLLQLLFSAQHSWAEGTVCRGGCRTWTAGRYQLLLIQSSHNM